MRTLDPTLGLAISELRCIDPHSLATLSDLHALSVAREGLVNKGRRPERVPHERELVL